jgi:hypothetical protein
MLFIQILPTPRDQVRYRSRNGTECYDASNEMPLGMYRDASEML